MNLVSVAYANARLMMISNYNLESSKTNSNIKFAYVLGSNTYWYYSKFQMTVKSFKDLKRQLLEEMGSPYSSSTQLIHRMLNLEILECFLVASHNADSTALLSDSSAPAAPIRPMISWRFNRCSMPGSICLYCSPLWALNSILSFWRFGIASTWKARRSTPHLNLKYLRTGNVLR